MVSKKAILGLMCMSFRPEIFGAEATDIDKRAVCPMPVTVTVTETVNKGSGEFHLTQPTSGVSSAVTPTSTKTVVKEVTDVLTVVGPSTSVQFDSGTSKKNGIVVTKWTTITVHSGHVSIATDLPFTVSGDVTTTKYSTRFTTDYVTLADSTSSKPVTYHVPPKPHSAVVTVAPYGNGTTSVSAHGSGVSTLAAGTGNLSRTVLSVTAPHPHASHNMTAILPVPVATSTAAQKGNGSLTITLPRPGNRHVGHSSAMAKHNTTCTETDASRHHMTLTKMHSGFTSVMTKLSGKVNETHNTSHVMTQSVDGKFKAPVYVTVHRGSNGTHSTPHARPYDTSSSAFPTLVTSGISSFPLSPLPPGVAPTTVSSQAPLLTSGISSFPLSPLPSELSTTTSSALAPLITTGGTPFSMAPLPPGVTPTTVNTTRAADPTAGIQKRSDVDMVYATIDGQLVSWSNQYTPSAASPKGSTTSWVFPTPVMPIPVSALVSYTYETPAPVAGTSSVTNSYGSFTLGPLPATTTARGGSATSTKTSGAPDAFCSGTELGNVVISFDDLPTYGEPANKTIYPPLPERYHHLFWSEGFSYVPPPSDPFPPQSGHQLGVFIVDKKANVHSENGPSIIVSPGLMPQPDYANGMIGAGPNFANNAYWFDVHSVYLGCHFTGEKHCQIVAHGWKYNETTGKAEPSATQYFYLPMCQGESKCALKNVDFNKEFTNLTSFQLQAVGLASGEPATYYLDDLEMQWSNDTCEANKIRNGDL